MKKTKRKTNCRPLSLESEYLFYNILPDLFMLVLLLFVFSFSFLVFVILFSSQLNSTLTIK